MSDESIRKQPGRFSWAPLLGYLLLLAGAKGALRSLGFARTIRWIRWYTHSRELRQVDLDVIVRISEDVARAAAFYPGRARCLEQSIVLYFCLLKQGGNAQLRIGVQPYGFLAHAWVEYEGRPINERDETMRGMVVFSNLGI